MRTAAQETAPQIGLRDCSKETVGEGQYIRFWWSGCSGNQALTLQKVFLLVMRNWYHYCFLDMRRYKDRDQEIRSDQIRSVAQSCPTLCDPMNLSTPGLPVHHQLPEFTETHVHRVSDAIQPSHPVSSPSPPAPNPSQHQSLFQWVNSSHEVAKVIGH